MDLTEIKAAARKAAFARRKVAFDAGLGSADRLIEAIRPHLGKAVSAYMAMRTEIDPLPAMELAARHGPVCVPVIIGKGQALKFRAWTPGCEMIDGEFGARIPASGDWIEPEVLIAPLVAFDRRGGRLGYGGGFYDRTLEMLRARRPTLAIGFAFAAQEADDLPLEPTDQPLDLIVTEAEILRPASR